MIFVIPIDLVQHLQILVLCFIMFTSINHSINQSINQSIDRSIDNPLIDRSIDGLIG